MLCSPSSNPPWRSGVKIEVVRSARNAPSSGILPSPLYSSNILTTYYSLVFHIIHLYHLLRAFPRLVFLSLLSLNYVLGDDLIYHFSSGMVGVDVGEGKANTATEEIAAERQSNASLSCIPIESARLA
jgi:hypothetical protein